MYNDILNVLYLIEEHLEIIKYCIIGITAIVFLFVASKISIKKDNQNNTNNDNKDFTELH